MVRCEQTTRKKHTIVEASRLILTLGIVFSIPVTAVADSGSGGMRRVGRESSSTAFSETESATITADTIKKVQDNLNLLGFDCGTSDGIAGGMTTEAVKAFQSSYVILSEETPEIHLGDEIIDSCGNRSLSHWT